MLDILGVDGSHLLFGLRMMDQQTVVFDITMVSFHHAILPGMMRQTDLWSDAQAQQKAQERGRKLPLAGTAYPPGVPIKRHLFW